MEPVRVSKDLNRPLWSSKHHNPIARVVCLPSGRLQAMGLESPGELGVVAVQGRLREVCYVHMVLHKGERNNHSHRQKPVRCPWVAKIGVRHMTGSDRHHEVPSLGVELGHMADKPD